VSRIGSNGRNGGDAGGVTPLSDGQRQIERAELGEHRIGPDAAREIAKNIEAQGGFWGPPTNG